ncbi:MAG: short-chain fatty acid transporter [Gemmatimonadetes bacterium]|nr:short-chain fatty acid transporter [Gemmatimonadota bacterium]
MTREGKGGGVAVLVARFGNACARWSHRWMPDPFVFALALNGIVLAAGLATWQSSDVPAIQGVLTAWYEGFWDRAMLAFGFQMALILVTGYAVAAAPQVHRALTRIAGFWKTPAQAVALTAAVTAVLSWLNWGLGLVGGAFLAREVGRVARERGQPIPYPLVAAAAYAGFLHWHGGLSGSAPLLVAQRDHAYADLVGAIPVSTTIFSRANLALSFAVLGFVPLLLALMARRAPAAVPGPDTPANAASGTPTARAEVRSVRNAGDAVIRARRRLRAMAGGAGRARAPGPAAVAKDPRALDDEEAPGEGVASRLDRSFAVALLALAPAAGALVFTLLPGWLSGSRGFDLNTVLFLFLAGGLALHRSPLALVRAFAEGAGKAGGILLQFPFYFAILGVMQASGLVTLLARLGVEASLWLASLGLPIGWCFQALTFLTAGLVNFAVPSGGGQWAVQGEIVLRTALDPAIGVLPARGVLALAYGDEWTNMMQPFWALPLLAVTNTRARDIMGYTTAVMFLTGPLYLIAFAL